MTSQGHAVIIVLYVYDPISVNVGGLVVYSLCNTDSYAISAQHADFCRTPLSRYRTPTHCSLHSCCGVAMGYNNGGRKGKRYEGRHCCLCGVPCGPHKQVLEADKDLLERAGYSFQAQRAGSQWYFCALCAGLSGVAERVYKFALMVSCGLVFFAQRCFPELRQIDSTGLRTVRSHMRQPSFKDTRHGAADFRLDRMSVYIYGPLADKYEGSPPGHVYFTIMFMRACCNDSSAAQSFVNAWALRGKGLLSPKTWDEELALGILYDIWDPDTHDMGYGARQLPQCHMGERGDFHEMGCRLMTKVADHLLDADASDLPWVGTRSNEKTTTFIADAIGMSTGGLWTVVVARDLGIVIARRGSKPVFDSSQCLDVGLNGVNGLNVILPQVSSKVIGANRPADRLQKLHVVTTPLVEKLVGQTILKYLPSIADQPQMTEHNVCEWMQQNTRKRTAAGDERANNVTKKRRCDNELSLFAASAYPRLGVQVLPCARKKSVSRVTDSEFVRAIRDAAPEAFTAYGCEAGFAQRLATFARKCK
jgi:hypothetical protein